jgi:hypothetical protein
MPCPSGQPAEDFLMRRTWPNLVQLSELRGVAPIVARVRANGPKEQRLREEYTSDERTCQSYG